MSQTGIPLMGFGTMETSDGSTKPEAMFNATKKALEVGYRHIDTAELYQTQEFVGKVIPLHNILSFVRHRFGCDVVWL
jgi:diketogulonate reductase-like aldo/keto reductase